MAPLPLASITWKVFSRAPLGNVLHDTTELLRGPGGGEPGHLGLQQLPASLSPEDEAVPGSAGLGSDNRNWTEVRKCHLRGTLPLGMLEMELNSGLCV